MLCELLSTVRMSAYIPGINLFLTLPLYFKCSSQILSSGFSDLFTPR